jgi:hypothetical protein
MMNDKFKKQRSGARRQKARNPIFTSAARSFAQRRSSAVAQTSSSLCPLLPSVQKRFGPFCGGAVLPRRPSCYGFTASSPNPPFRRTIQSEEPIKMKIKPDCQIALINYHIKRHLRNIQTSLPRPPS